MNLRLSTTLGGRIAKITAPALALCLSLAAPAIAQTSTENDSAAVVDQTSTATERAVSCFHEAAIPVALAPGQAATATVSGELCATPAELRAGTTIQLLVQGATYNHDYWDFGTVHGKEYSYARDIAAHGFPTFAFDGIGSGRSSHPPSEQVTVQSAAYVAHQIVQGLRSGSITGIQFGKVIIVGHSLGSTAVWEEAISYADVDGVIITGAAHSITTKFLTAHALYPAVDDPKFATSGLDAGYLTTVPGVRSTLFYSFPDYDPAIVPIDEARKDVVSASELGTGISLVNSTASQLIQVPVLTILGSNDFTTCGLNPQGGNFECSSGALVATQEVPFYSPKARIHGCVVHGSGHDLNLAVNRRLAAADAVAWSSAFVGQQRLERQDFDSSDRGLPWNDGLPWNCGAPSAESK